MNNQKRIELIKIRINQALSPEKLEVIDDSYRHRKHPGAQSGKGHFIVKIKANALEHLSKVKAHRLIYQSVNDLFETDIHALNIIIL